MGTKVVAISDTHMNFPDLPKADLCIHAGDWTYRGQSKEVKKSQKWIDSQRDKFRNWVGVAGNHDFNFHKDTFKGVQLLFEEEAFIDGIRIYGTPMTPIFYNWAFIASEEDLYDYHFAKIPEGLDILISHGPPRDVLDKNIRGEICGSTALRRRLFEMKNPPKVVVFGHIHLDKSGPLNQNHININGIDFYNVSYCNESYKPDNGIVKFSM